MKRIIKLITWYAVMCLSGEAGAVGIVCLKGKDRINFLSPIREKQKLFYIVSYS